MIPIISIVGRSNSGKTTLITGLVAELKRRGYRVAVIKHSSAEVEPDTLNKDTWRFTQAGSDVSAITTESRFAMFKKLDRALSPEELYYFTGWDYDVILAEGYKHSDYPKIEVHRRDLGPELVSEPSQLLALVTDEPVELAVPQFSKDDAGSIADLVERRMAAFRRPAVDISADGVPIVLSDSARDALFRTLTAMLAGTGQTAPENYRIAMRRRA